MPFRKMEKSVQKRNVTFLSFYLHTQFHHTNFAPDLVSEGSKPNVH